MEKFLYIVKPRIPIRNLVKGKLIFKETSLMLNLDEVRMCLKHGPVYRKFANDSKTAIQVTLNNCERLHQRDYVTELNVASTFIPKEESTKPVEPIKEEVVETAKEDVVEVVEEAPAETTEEVVEVHTEAANEEVATETTEETVEAADAEVENKTENQEQVQKNNNHNNTKNKKRK